MEWYTPKNMLFLFLSPVTEISDLVSSHFLIKCQFTVTEAHNTFTLNIHTEMSLDVKHYFKARQILP
jgi:hypothetical protein